MREKEREQIISYYKRSIERIDEQIADLVEERSDYEARMHELEMTLLLDHSKNDDYDKSAPLWKKSVSALGKLGAISTTRQIATEINELEGNKYDDKNLRELISALSATLKQKVDKKETFDRLVSLDGEIFYGLKEWFKDGILLEQYYSILL